MGEARLDIEDSEVAYLGYYHAESYGLSWKVMGVDGRGGGVAINIKSENTTNKWIRCVQWR